MPQIRELLKWVAVLCDPEVDGNAVDVRGVLRRGVGQQVMTQHGVAGFDNELDGVIVIKKRLTRAEGVASAFAEVLLVLHVRAGPHDKITGERSRRGTQVDAGKH